MRFGKDSRSKRGYMKRIFLMACLCLMLRPANAMLITTIPIGATTTTFTVTGSKQALTSEAVDGFTITGSDFLDGGVTFPSALTELGAVWEISPG